jgi:5-methylthioadenosine/S-adenosylhomocysteine deaminase
VLREAVELAHELDLPIHTHVSETRGEVATWFERTGESPVATFDRLGVFDRPTIAAHCVHVSEEDIAVLAARGVTVAHCPKSNGKLGSGVAPIAKMKAAGVNVALGTDGAASNNRLDMFEEMRHACFLQRARHEDSMLLAASDVLAMATENGRKVFGLSSGRLEAGAEADLVLVDSESVHLSPLHDGVSSLVYSAGASDITDVIVGGRFLLRNRELLTIDEEKVKAEVERVLRR